VKKEILQKGLEKVVIANKLRYISRIDSDTTKKESKKLTCILAFPPGSHDYEFFEV
jgi:hypothetical protein